MQFIAVLQLEKMPGMFRNVGCFLVRALSRTLADPPGQELYAPPQCESPCWGQSFSWSQGVSDSPRYGRDNFSYYE
jgi:hypothetical protein